MGYPYGPEPYPTFGEAEASVDVLRASYMTEKDLLDRETEFAFNHPELASAWQKGLAAQSEAALSGLAFGRALDSLGLTNGSDRFMQDLFAIMDDQLVSERNERAKEDEETPGNPRWQAERLANRLPVVIMVKDYTAHASMPGLPDLKAEAYVDETGRAVAGLRRKAAQLILKWVESDDPRLLPLLSEDELPRFAQAGYGPAGEEKTAL